MPAVGLSSRIVRFVIFFGLLAVLLPRGPAHAESEDPATVPCALAEDVEMHPGPLVTDVLVGAVVPEPGESVTAHADLVAGYEELVVTTLESGEVEIGECGTEGSGGSSSALIGVGTDDVEDLEDAADEVQSDPQEFTDETAASDPEEASGGESPKPNAKKACRDKDYKPLGFKWKTTLHWTWYRESAPDYLSKDEVLDAIQQSVNSIIWSRNSCGMSDEVGATRSFDGSSGGTRANIGVRTEDGQQVYYCKQRDDKNVVDFGNLPPTTLGLTCWSWTSDSGLNKASEADIRLNKSDGVRWYLPGMTCTSEHSIRAVGTHEWGHAYGLDHVHEPRHGNLTMSKYINGPCQESEYTLGHGDVLGLRDLY